MWVLAWILVPKFGSGTTSAPSCARHSDLGVAAIGILSSCSSAGIDLSVARSTA